MNPALGWFLVSLAGSAVLGKPILDTLIRLKSRQTIHKDAPEGHQIKAGTPTMGGFIILAGAIPALVLAMAQGEALALPTLIVLIGFSLIGFIDDYVVPRMLAGKRGLGWTQKLAMQIVLAGLALAMLPSLSPLGWALGMFFILFFTNAYNFSDGLDGLAGSLAIWLCLGFALLSGSWLPMTLLGGIAVFLIFNAPPARVFMGDVGALGIGAVFGLFFFTATFGGMNLVIWKPVTDFAGYVSSPIFLAAAVLSLVMIAELVPVPLQIFWVKVFKKRLFPYTPIHHAFEKAGWPETRVTFLFVMVQLMCTILAVLMAVRS